MPQSSSLHLAIVMDGNGRWATRRGLPRVAGHRAGAEAVRRTVEAAPGLGVAALTLYAFSADNWKRPAAEVAALMRLLARYLRTETPRLAQNDVRLELIGRRDRLPGPLLAAIGAAEHATARGARLHLRLAVDYSSRWAIGAAALLPDVDLLIRTGGEQRLSDFLLWECAYAELYFTDTMWPDFGAAEPRPAADGAHPAAASGSPPKRRRDERHQRQDEARPRDPRRGRSPRGRGRRAVARRAVGAQCAPLHHGARYGDGVAGASPPRAGQLRRPLARGGRAPHRLELRGPRLRDAPGIRHDRPGDRARGRLPEHPGDRAAGSAGLALPARRLRRRPQRLDRCVPSGGPRRDLERAAARGAAAAATGRGPRWPARVPVTGSLRRPVQLGGRRVS